MSSDKNLRGSPEQGRQRLAELAAATNAKFGSHVALPLSQVGVARILKLPFGIFELDWRTAGGLPFNRISRIWGKPSSLKSTTCLKVVRNAQQFCRHCKLPLVENPITGERDCFCPNPRWTLTDQAHFGILNTPQSLAIQYGQLPEEAKIAKDGFAWAKLAGLTGKAVKVEFHETERCEPFRCLYIDTEGTVDESWARANGVDTSLLLLIGGSWAEQVLDLTEDLILTKEVDLVILDSLDMLTPGDTLSKALSQTPQVAAKAGIMNRAVQKWTGAINEGGLLNRYTPTIVVVAQVRSQHIGKPWACLGPSGGWAIGHGISLDIRLEPLKYEYKGADALFGNFGYKIAKSKAGGFPRSEGKFRFWLRPGHGRQVGDTEDLGTVMDHALEHDFLTKSADGWHLKSQFLGKKAKRFKLKKSLVSFLEENPSVYLDLRTRVLSHLIGEDISITLPSEKLAQQEVKEAKMAKATKGPKKKKKGGLDDLLSLID